MTTAPSTQPPDTEPITSPSSLTAMAAPGSRGPGALEVDDPGAGPPPCPGARQRARSRSRSLIARSPRPAPRATRASGPRRARRRAAGRRPCPAASGANPGLAFSGLTHTRRWATRCSRRTCSPSTAGSPRSHPSERITTTAPRARPRRPHVSLKVRSPSPRRVPPDQSSTTPAAASRAASGSWDRSSRVMRVHRRLVLLQLVVLLALVRPRVPARAQQQPAALRQRAVLGLPRAQVVDRQHVVGVGLRLGHAVDHDGRPDEVRGAGRWRGRRRRGR